MKNPWITTDSTLKYDNPWIQVTEHDVINPSGGKGIYGTVHFKNLAIAILPIDDEGNTWLVGQYRYPLNKYSWELPEGGGSLEIDPLISAKRELLEETGITAGTWEPILQMHLSNSSTDEKSISYLATELVFGKAEPEETEQLEIKKVPLLKAVQMCHDGEITDALSVATLYRAHILFSSH